MYRQTFDLGVWSIARMADITPSGADQRAVLEAPLTIAPDTVPAVQPPTESPKPPPRYCTICCEQGLDYIRPCRICSADYCLDCLLEMFDAAITTPSRFPPKCHNMLQLFTVRPHFPADKVKAYRLKLEEFLTLKKTYCPAPACSAFIAPRLIPEPRPQLPSKPTLNEMLQNLFDRVHASQHARFFRGRFDFQQFPGYLDVVEKPIDLERVQAKIKSNDYISVAGLAQDINLIANNAKLYNGPVHPITNAAQKLFDFFIESLSTIANRELVAGSAEKVSQAHDIFPCPDCHISICTLCKQVEHRGEPCDTSTQDGYEAAILQQFGYKRCPRCGHGVRRMHGCPHMQCLCGAHWCYWCLRSIDACGGGCEPDSSDMEDEDEGDGGEDSEDDGDEMEIENAPEYQTPAPNDNSTNGTAEASVARVPLVVNIVPPEGSNAPPIPTNTARSISDPAPQASAIELPARNLDAGGDRVWAEMAERGAVDFGDEPNEDGEYGQIWSCNHCFSIFKPLDGGFDHGNLDLMECNLCFRMLKPRSASTELPMVKRKRSKAPPKSDVRTETEAWECELCSLTICNACRQK